MSIYVQRVIDITEEWGVLGSCQSGVLALIANDVQEKIIIIIIIIIVIIIIIK